MSLGHQEHVDSKMTGRHTCGSDYNISTKQHSDETCGLYAGTKSENKELIGT